MSDSPETYVDEFGFTCRIGTNDGPIIAAVLLADEYRLRDRPPLTGWALDIGAHIGAVACTLARQHPRLRVLAVEAVPENFALLERNIANLGLGDRITAIHAWAGAPGQATGTCYYGYTGGDVESADYVSQHRFIGDTWHAGRAPAVTVDLPSVSLDDLLATHGIDEVELLKIDCEGCEWSFLDTAAVARVRYIVGEYHSGVGTILWPEDTRGHLAELLGATHDIDFWTDRQHGDFAAARR